MLSSVLIANRGEIACRIARTAARLGLRTIAVYSDADAGAPHVRLCDEAYLIGPAPARDSYLAIDKLIAVALRAKAACIHPGYGFLAENADFAEACASAGIVFVGPPPTAIRAMGQKDRAKTLMERAGVPVVPGYHGERQEPKFLKEKAYEIGYPVLIKALSGGGGKGMRRVDKHADFDAALESAAREATSAFGDPRVLVEKYIASPRHIEVQIFGDTQGDVVHLYERDCSLQRRHQKVIEEAPAPGMTPPVREAITTAAVAAAKAVGYVGAGTVEFIADAGRGLRADGFWFMEMNTRLQVEHPVTEAITGIDLVEWQFRIAAGEALPLRQADIPLSGHAAEARLYAEDPERGFLPSTGRLIALDFPRRQNIRIDTGVEAGSDVTPFYDPMLAKVIAHGPTREVALDRLADALEGTVVAGPRTNVAFLASLCRADGFRRGEFDTGFIERNLSAFTGAAAGIDKAAAALGVAWLLDPRQGEQGGNDRAEAASPWDAADGFQLGGARTLRRPFVVDGTPIEAHVSYAGGRASVSIDGVVAASDGRTIGVRDGVFVLRKGRQTSVRFMDYSVADASHSDNDGIVRAPMHGKVLALLVEPGAIVAKGQQVAIIEAMKMEHALTAPFAGEVVETVVEAGAVVADGAAIVVIRAAQEEEA